MVVSDPVVVIAICYYNSIGSVYEKAPHSVVSIFVISSIYSMGSISSLKAFCILLCWTRYTNLHQFGVAFYEFLWFFVNLWKMRFGLAKGFVGIYRETLGFINLLEYGNA